MAQKERELKNLIVNCSGEENLLLEKITENTNLVYDLNFDSIKLIRLVVEIERNFKVKISDEDLVVDRISQYSNLLKMVEELEEK